MGCCPSTTRKPDPVTRSTSSRRRTTAAPPPPPPEEEETVVKEVLSETPKPLTPNPTRFPLKPISKPPEAPDASESSEITVSTVPPEEEYSGEVRRPAVRSPAKSGTRRYSGELRNPGRGPSPGRVGTVGRERSMGAAAARRRENGGETSGRRDNSSPAAAAAAARSGLGRNLSGKKTGRVGSEISDRRIEEKRVVAPTVGDESLENPLVSLECFIFL